MRRAPFALLVALALPLLAMTSAHVALADAPQAPAPTAAGAADTAAVVTKVQAFYDKTQTFTSDFTQEFWVKAYNQKKHSKGKVTIQKPGKMHWHYDDPRDNKVVSDGATIKIYEAANKQMYEQAVDKSQFPAALSFLTGTGKLADTFTFELFPGETLAFPGGQVLVGTPKVATPAYQKVLFYIDAATSQVRQVMVLDGQGNRNKFVFVSPRVNDVIPPEHFKFTPPAGTQIVKP